MSHRLADGDHECRTKAAAASASSSLARLVVVTGGSKGIGRSCVEAFAQRGARVLFTYCSDAAASKEVERSFRPGQVRGVQLDQGDFDSVRAFAAEVDRWREGQAISTVVNNAALGSATVSLYRGIPDRPISRGCGGVATTPGKDEEAFTGAGGYDAARRRADEDMAMMCVNSLGPMWVTEALLPMMAPSKAAGAPDDSAAAENDGDRETAAPAASASPVDDEGGQARPPILSPSFLGGTGKKRTVMFIGSVGGGSQAVFPGFRAADAMSKAAVAYACKYFAAQSRQLRQQTNHASAPVPDPAAQPVAPDRPPPCDSSSCTCCSSGPTGGGAAPAAPAAPAVGTVTATSTPATTTTAAKFDFSDPSGGVDFVCLCPGATLTDMFRASTLGRMEARGPEAIERFLRALPQGRLMLPEEIGEAVYWLCSSPAATMFHGAVIDASAGLAVRPGVLTEYTC